MASSWLRGKDFRGPNGRIYWNSKDKIGWGRTQEFLRMSGGQTNWDLILWVLFEGYQWYWEFGERSLGQSGITNWKKANQRLSLSTFLCETGVMTHDHHLSLESKAGCAENIVQGQQGLASGSPQRWQRDTWKHTSVSRHRSGTSFASASVLKFCGKID